jgi:nitrogen fixation protein FixH
MMEALKALISKKRLPPLANSQDMPGSRTYPSLCPSEKTPELYIFENTRDQLIGKIVTTSVVGGVVVAGALWAGAAGIGGQNLFWGSVVQALPGIVSALFAGAVVNNVIKIDQHFENSVMKAYRMAKNAGMDWARMVAWNSVTYNLLETWNPLQVRPNQTSFLDATPDRSMAQVKAHIREAAAYAFNELQKSASIPAAQRASPGMRDPVHDQRLEMIAGHLADYKNRTMSVPQWLAVPGMVGGLVCVLKSVADVIHFIDKF